MNLRLIEQAYCCSTMQGGGRLKVRARLCRWPFRWRVLAARTTHLHLQVVCLCNGSRHEPPTDRASLRLLDGARRRPTEGVVLVSAAGTSWAACDLGS